MVFQDGGTFVSRDGQWRVPIVLDNLIQRKELPIMAAVFVNLGRSKHDDGLASEQRSLEYDTLSGTVRPVPADGGASGGPQISADHRRRPGKGHRGT
jgi:hypothetical protein